MFRIRLISLCILAALLSSHANAVFAPADPATRFQIRIDSAFRKILSTKTGLAICREILGADASAIQFHLGVSKVASISLAAGCASAKSDSPWVVATFPQDIHKLTLNPNKGRSYALVKSNKSSPIESWTDPLSNLTTLLEDPEGMSESRLISLLSHETGVYFDSKIDPLHPEAQHLSQLRDLKFQTHAKLSPMVAVLDPFVANALTFIRALQVEFSITDELVARGEISPPADSKNDYLRLLISDGCQDTCILDLIGTFRTEFGPIAAPLVALSPRFRREMQDQIPNLGLNWTPEQWGNMQSTLNSDPNQFIKQHFRGNALQNIQQVFARPEEDQPQLLAATAFMKDLSHIEEEALATTTVDVKPAIRAQPLLQFLKVPLLSGYNILLSAGPRARVRTGGTE